MTKTLLATTVALALGATAAFAQTTASRTKVDADGDGRITRAEAAVHPRLAERFAALDTNRDGFLDAGERPQRVKGRGMAMLDADKDGRISRAEAAKHPKFAERFATLDTNRDGFLDASERPQRGTHGKGRGMAMLDADKDGRISRAEAAKHPKFAERFATLDTNRDGFLDASERPQRGTHGKGRGMAMLDADKDGRISRMEAGKHPKFAERFTTLDTNRDGFLDASERPQRGTHGKARGMAMLDADKDGRISRAEAGKHPKLAERFATLDANRDGVLTREEMAAARKGASTPQR